MRTRSLPLVFLIALANSAPESSAQGCPEGDILIQSQEALEGFVAAHPECRDIPGHLVLFGEVRDTAPFAGIRSVHRLTISYLEEAAIEFQSLESVDFWFAIRGSSLRRFRFPALRTLKWVMDIGISEFEEFSFPSLESAAGIFMNTVSTPSLEFPELRDLGALVAVGVEGPEVLSFPSWEVAWDNICLSSTGTPGTIREFSAPLLSEVRSFSVQGISLLEEIRVPALRSISGQLVVIHNPLLERCCSLARALETSGSIWIERNGPGCDSESTILARCLVVPVVPVLDWDTMFLLAGVFCVLGIRRIRLRSAERS